MPLQLLEQLERHARERPDTVAWSVANAERLSYTWSELHAGTSLLAERLVRDASPGDVLLICCSNRPEFVVAFLAGLAAGLRVFPVSPGLTPAELAAAATQSAARLAVATPEAQAALRGLRIGMIPVDELSAPRGNGVPVSANAAITAITPSTRGPAVRPVNEGGLLLQSSGTTGLPKIVFRNAASLDAVAAAMAAAIDFRPGDRVLSCVPLCHSYGIEHGLLAPLWAGSSVRLCQGFDLPTVMAELDAGATIFPGVPFIYETLARQAAGKRYPHLRAAYSAGGPLPDAVRDACRESLGLVVTQLYGATEIGSVTYSDPRKEGFNPGSVGRAMAGVVVRILPVDATTADNSLPPMAEGQVAVKAGSMFAGYLDGSSAPLLDGYFVTGDLGHLDAVGNLTLTGRLKLLIDVAGLKVNPLEVEAVLAEHPAVAASVVVSLPVTQTVSRLKAIVVRRPGSNAGGEEIRQFLRGRLAAYKVPRVVEFREALPRSAAGKVLRQQVEES
ncbi:class I adenylate-forming enzyme family protein [Humisphaera borealis]|uniref:Acyl--CoA ligase n=1 Tax=Humisphaera borealis TaxID=2807512 RepID=A0A7M2WQK9_9BACT|nr:class I adenylate-forming enzyme family protein [Humisphaera borealis]QOV87689.1 acyl--CoA ligase [Humisphaera borealis]